MANNSISQIISSALLRGLLAATLVLTVSTHAEADPLHDVARDQARAGKLAYEAGDFKLARLKFELAFAAQRTPAIALWRARVARKQGQLMRALSLYEQAAAMSNESKSGAAAHAQAAAKAEKQNLLLQVTSSSHHTALITSR